MAFRNVEYAFVVAPCVTVPGEASEIHSRDKDDENVVCHCCNMVEPTEEIAHALWDLPEDPWILDSNSLPDHDSEVVKIPLQRRMESPDPIELAFRQHLRKHRLHHLVLLRSSETHDAG